MLSKEINNDELLKEYSIVLLNSNLEDKVDKELEHLSKNLKLPGFRKGKASTSVVKKKYYTSLREEAISKFLDSEIKEIIDKNKFSLLKAPYIFDIKEEENKDVSVKVKLELIPYINTSGLDKISMTNYMFSIDDKDIEKELSNVLKYNKEYEASKENDISKDGDKLLIDFKGKIDGKPFKNSDIEDFELILGNSNLTEDFDKNLLDSKSGSKIVFKTELNHIFGKENQGKEADFEVNIKNILKPRDSSIDEIVQKMHLKDAEELKTKIKEEIQKNYDQQLYVYQKVNLFDKLEDILDFPIPPSMMKNELDALSSQLNSDNQNPIDQEKIAKRRIRIGMFLSEYAAKNGIKVDTDDMTQILRNKIHEFPGYEKDVEATFRKNPSLLKMWEGTVLEDKSVKHILEKMVTKEIVECSIEELSELLKKEYEKRENVI